MSRRVCIVGGGISGLSAAYRLGELAQESGEPLQITLLEKSDRLGGVIETKTEPPFLLEAGPDAFITDKPWGLNLIKRLGLEAELMPTQSEHRRSFILKAGKLHPVPQGWYLIAPGKLTTLFQTPLLSWRGKLRMACEPWIRSDSGIQDESVAQFIRRRFGTEVLDRIGQPMLAGVYTADPESLSLLATFPQLKRMEQQHGSVIRGLRAQAGSGSFEQASGARYRLFVTLKGGMQRLIQALVEQIPEGTIRTGSRVNQLAYDGAWQVGLDSGESLEVDQLVLALPSLQAADLLRSVSPDLAKRLGSVRYESVATVHLAYEEQAVSHPLDGFGFVLPVSEGDQLIGCSFSHRKFSGRAPKGKVLLRAFVGGAFGRELLNLSDEVLLGQVESAVQRILGIHATSSVRQVCRYDQAMPVYPVGHLENLKAVEEEQRYLPGLYLAGNGYRGIGIPDCIHQAEQAAENMLRQPVAV